MPAVAPLSHTAPHRAVLEGLERVLVVLLLFAFTGVHQTLVFGPVPETAAELLRPFEDREAARLLWLPVYGVALLLFVGSARRMTAIAFSNPALCLLLALAPLSTVWSIAPADTLRRSAALLMTAGFGIYLAARFDSRTQLRLLAWALIAALVLSLATAAIWPEIGVMTQVHEGAVRGLFPHRNTLALYAALAVLLALVLYAVSGHGRPLFLAGAGPAIAGVLLSRSATAPAVLVLVLLTVPLLAFVRAHRLHPTVVLLWASVLALVASAGIAWFEDVVLMLQRDPTLTGRTLLWSEAWEHIIARPLLGYGYGAFWGPAGGPADELRLAVGWLTPSVHSGYLDLWLSLGALGFGLFLVAALTTAVRLVIRVPSVSAPEAYGPTLVLVFILIYNFSESQLLDQNSLLTVALVTALLSNCGRRRTREGIRDE
jgi:exopolysaccharide production protein ExoQ